MIFQPYKKTTRTWSGVLAPYFFWREGSFLKWRNRHSFLLNRPSWQGKYLWTSWPFEKRWMQSYAVSYGDSETVFQKRKTVLGNEKIDPEDRTWFCAQHPKALPAGTSHRSFGPVASFQHTRCDVEGSIPPAVMLLLPIFLPCFLQGKKPSSGTFFTFWNLPGKSYK